jgi:hypothetical protein
VLKPCGEAVARFVDYEARPHHGFALPLALVVTTGAHEHDFAADESGELLADADFLANIDQTNYRNLPKTDLQGRIHFPALIPGATYRLSTFEDGKTKILKEFSVESGEQLDLGDLTIDFDE